MYMYPYTEVSDPLSRVSHNVQSFIYKQEYVKKTRLKLNKYFPSWPTLIILSIYVCSHEFEKKWMLTS